MSLIERLRDPAKFGLSFDEEAAATMSEAAIEIIRLRSALDEIGYASWPGDDAIARIKSLARASLDNSKEGEK